MSDLEWQRDEDSYFYELHSVSESPRLSAAALYSSVVGHLRFCDMTLSRDTLAVSVVLARVRCWLICLLSLLSSSLNLRLNSITI